MQSIRCGLLLHMQRVMPLSRLVTIVSRTKRLNRSRRCLGCQHARAENYVYIGCSDVKQFMATMRSPFCGYNTTSCVELNGEYLSCYSNKIESFSSRKCPRSCLPPVCKQNLLLFIQPRWQLRRTYLFNHYNVLF